MPEKIICLHVVTSNIYAFRPAETGGLTVNEVIKEWFIDYSLNRYHASRDTFLLGNSKQVMSVVEVKEKDLKSLIANDVYTVTYYDAEDYTSRIEYVRAKNAGAAVEKVELHFHDPAQCKITGVFRGKVATEDGTAVEDKT